MKASKKLTVVLAAAAATLALGSFAWAAIPGGGGVISGCYDKSSGQLRVTDAATNLPKGCSSKEATLAWNQQGPQGIQGVPGPQGDPGLSSAHVYRVKAVQTVNSTETVLAATGEPAGKYLVSAKVVIGTNSSSGYVTCFLYDGDYQVGKKLDTSTATVSWPFGGPETTLSLSAAAGDGVAFVNPQVICSASGGGFASNVVITATKVGTLLVQG
jgi:hypothetical protein